MRKIKNSKLGFPISMVVLIIAFGVGYNSSFANLSPAPESSGNSAVNIKPTEGNYHWTPSTGIAMATTIMGTLIDHPRPHLYICSKPNANICYSNANATASTYIGGCKWKITIPGASNDTVQVENCNPPD